MVFKGLLLAQLLCIGAALNAQLSGNYLVNIIFGDFQTIDQAVNAMVTQGISGPVSFQLTGTSFAPVVIPPIPGSSAVNTIRFYGSLSDSTVTKFTVNTTGPVVLLDGVDHIRFDHLLIANTSPSLGNCIEIGQGSSDVHISSCKIVNASGSPNNAGLYVSSTSDIGTCLVSQCSIENKTAVSVVDASVGKLSILNSVLQNVNYGLTASNSSIELDFSENQLDILSAPSSAISLSGQQGEVLVNANSIVGSAVNGIYLNDLQTTSLVPLVVTNNSIISDHAFARGISATNSSGTAFCEHNSISLSGPASVGVLIDMTSSNMELGLRNCAIKSEGYAADVYSFPSSNTFVSNVLNSISFAGVRWNGTIFTTSFSLSVVSATNTNSSFADPEFLNAANDLKLLSSSPCISAGEWPVTNATDILGNTRPNPSGSLPDIGAFESAEGVVTPMNGSYTISSSGVSDYDSFGSAVSALVQRGINGPVKFDISPGTFVEQVSIPAIAGTSSMDTILFQGVIADSSAVELSWSPNNVEHVLELNGVDHIHFSHLSISSSSFAAQLFEVHNGSTNWSISNCSFAGGIYGVRMQPFPGPIQIAARIGSCRFSSISHALYLPSGVQGSLSVQDCRFIDCQNGFIAQGTAALVLEDNVFNNVNASPGTAISLGNSPQLIPSISSCVIRRNIIKGDFDRGIVMSHVEGTSLNPIRIENNVIAQTFFATSGIAFFTRSAFIQVYNNSINSTNGIVFAHTHVGSEVTIVNNAIRSLYSPLNVPIAGSVSACDHNVFHSVQGHGVLWGGVEYLDIPALDNATAMNGNSQFGDPKYIDPTTDLRLLNGSPCLGAGSNAVQLSVDINGAVRPSPVGSPIDVGAFELNGPVRPLVNVYLEGAYPGSGSLMNDDLRVQGLIPMNEPYTAMGYAWVTGGGEELDPSLLNITGSSAIVDWVIVQLRDGNDPSIVIADRAATLRRNGFIRGSIGSEVYLPVSASDQYHVTILHRNHLGVMSQYPITIGNGTLVNFTVGLIPTWGTEGMKDSNGSKFMWAGDAGFDQEIKYIGASNDRDPLLQVIGGSVPTSTVTGYFNEDLDLNGSVKYIGSGNDRDLILVNIGGNVPTNTRQAQLP